MEERVVILTLDEYREFLECRAKLNILEHHISAVLQMTNPYLNYNDALFRAVFNISEKGEKNAEKSDT